MNNKNIFSVKLFLQSLKQTRLMGFIMTAILLLVSLFPVVKAISAELMINDMNSIITVDGASECESLMITFCVIAPLITLNIWGFLNKRNSSDFYHSLPYKRVCIFLSKLAAIVTWIFGMLLLSYVLMCVLYLMFNRFFFVDYGMLALTYLSVFICNLLCVASVSLACAFTGTTFSNICVSLIIIFGPRFFMYLLQSAIKCNAKIVVEEKALGLLSQVGNTLTESVFSVFLGTSNVFISNDLFNNIYTFMLAIVYFVIAGIIFNKRKSESAGKDGGGLFSRTIIRISIGFMICIVAVLSCVSSMTGISGIGEDNDYNDIFYLVCLFIVAAIVVIVYEWVVSKNFRRIINCLPSIGVAYAFSIAVGVGVAFYCQGILDYEPQAEDVKYVQISTAKNIYAYEDNYFSSKVGQIKITDANIIADLCKAVEHNATLIKENKINGFVARESTERYKVYIKDGIFGSYRTVYLDEEAVNGLQSNLSKLDEYKDAYLDLPPIDKTAMNNWSHITKDYKKYNEEVYKTLLTELQTVKLSDWISNINSYQYNHTFNASFVMGGKVYEERIPVTSYMPKTKSAYLNAVNELYIKYRPEVIDMLLKDIKNMRNNGKAIETDKADIKDIVVYIHKNGSEEYDVESLDTYIKTNKEETNAILDKVIADLENVKKTGQYVPTDFDFTKDYYCIDFSMCDESGECFFVEYYFNMEK